MKLILHSNAVTTPTGYGVQSALFIPRIMGLGHEVIHSGFYGLQGTPLKMDDLLILPTSKDPYGNDVLAEDFKHWQADITITLVDVWIFNPNVTSSIRWVPWFPVDTDPIPPGVANILRTAYKPIAYARYGVEKAAEAGFKIEYVPHGVDTQYYAPLDKAQARRDLGMPEDRLDWFIVGLVAANKGNPSRKAFDQQIRAFAEFHKQNPRSILALHTDCWGGYEGENVLRICQLAGLDIDCVALPPKYQFLRGMLGPDYLRKLYSASDVLLNATRGEGFGVPIIEAMSCGTPAIVTDFSAMPELIDAGAGWKIPYVDKFFYQDTYQVTPSVVGIVKALGEALDAKGNGELAKMGEKARAGMIATYDADLVTERYWKPVLAQIEGELNDLKAKTQARAAKRAALRANGTKPEPIAAPAVVVTVVEPTPEVLPVQNIEPVKAEEKPLTEKQVEQVLVAVAEAIKSA